jgi:hypothetical protein
MLYRKLASFTALTILSAATACSGDSADSGAAADSADRRDSAAAAGDSGRARGDTASRLASIPGFNTPESVKYDADLDVYFVSNINGNPSQKDGNGYIARVKPDTGSGHVTDTLVHGGRNGATLNAPKGMAIIGDTLWVADIDAVRGFNKRTGRPTRTVNFASMQATFLNDIAADSGGTVYVTDTGIRFNPDGSMGTPGKQRIFRFKGTTAPTAAIENDSLGNPNGIAWDESRSAFIVGPFSGRSVMTWAGGDSAMRSLASGPGEYDGVEVLTDGRILVSSWADSSVHVITGGEMRKLIGRVPAPADIGYDSRRNRVLVPLFNGNSVEIWTTGRQ